MLGRLGVSTLPVDTYLIVEKKLIPIVGPEHDPEGSLMMEC